MVFCGSSESIEAHRRRRPCKRFSLSSVREIIGNGIASRLVSRLGRGLGGLGLGLGHIAIDGRTRSCGVLSRGEGGVSVRGSGVWWPACAWVVDDLLRIRRPNGESFSGREFSLRENGEWLCFSPYILVQAGDTRYGMGRGGCTERRRDSGIAAQKMIDVTNMASVWYGTIGPARTPR